LFLMKNYNSPDIINVGSSIDVTIKELAETIKNKIGFTGDIVWDTTKPNGTPLRKLCNEKINSLGWVSKTVLGDGISKTIDWYMANKKNYYRN